MAWCHWIESGLFAAGLLPGMAGLEELFGDGDIGALVGDDLSGDLGSMLETLRLWTIAHEVGHL